MVDGWISVTEMELVARQMQLKGNTGVILEVGAAAGRLFDFLYAQFPHWTYVAVDPWAQEKVRLQIDWAADYFAPGNLSDIITKDLFVTNCPFAVAHEAYFENWKTEQRFDIISMGLVSKKINWNTVYQHATTMLKDDGVIVARNLRHKVYGEYINQAVNVLNFNSIDSAGGSCVYERR